jgi:hypothetical protein
MKLTRAILAMGAVIWWAVFVSRGADDILPLVTALGLTITWVCTCLAHADRRLDQILKDHDRDSR